MEATEDNDLRGPALSRINYVQGAPLWWTRGAKIRRKSDGQKGRAAYGPSGDPVACLERGISGVFKYAAQFSDWESDEEPISLTDMDKARITYAADRALLTSLGLSGVAEWSGLVEQRRIAWMGAAAEGLPLDGEYGELRTKLRMAILKTLAVGHG